MTKASDSDLSPGGNAPSRSGAGTRPAHVRPPTHWTHSEPPTPGANREEVEHGAKAGPEPTRYGDWEQKGIARDF